MILMAVICLALQCARDPLLSSGSSVSGNAKVSGLLNKKDGTPASRAIVMLIPSNFNPLANARAKIMFIDTADSEGKYEFPEIPQDSYSIEAKNILDGEKMLMQHIEVLSDSDFIKEGILQNTGAIKIMLPSGIDTVNGYIFIPGTDISALLKYQSDFAVLDSVPVGAGIAVSYAAKGSAQPPKLLAENITVIPDSTVTIQKSAWLHSEKLYFNTTSSGANVMGNVMNFPALIRLNSNNFVFSEAKAGGDDIRFASSNNDFLPYEIERWDAAGCQAEIWVDVDTLFGNNESHYIVMYWGNAGAAPTGNSASVFDTSKGFQGVWHFSQPGNAVAVDATTNHFDGIPYNLSPTSTVPGAIGMARQFDGQSSYIAMPGTASSALDFSKNGIYSVSAWVNVDSLNQKYRIVASKGNKQYNLQLKNTNEWEFAEFRDNPADTVGWEESTSPAASGAWTYVVGMRVGMKQYLYINGSCVDSSIILFPLKALDTLRQRDQTNNFTIGKLPDSPSYYFAGKIDEVRVSSGQLSGDWIRLCYMNQRSDDKLITYKQF
jgi:hypothetical protein